MIVRIHKQTLTPREKHFTPNDQTLLRLRAVGDTVQHAHRIDGEIAGGSHSFFVNTTHFFLFLCEVVNIRP